MRVAPCHVVGAQDLRFVGVAADHALALHRDRQTDRQIDRSIDIRRLRFGDYGATFRMVQHLKIMPETHALKI